MNRLSWLLALALVASACRDECDPKTFDAGCEGNVLVFCPEPGVDQVVPIRIRRDDCGGKFCVAAARVCALASSPEPLCADAGYEVCESGTSQLTCSDGFALSRAPCRSCDAGRCEGGPSSRCSADSDCAAGLRCADAGTASWCREQ